MTYPEKEVKKRKTFEYALEKLKDGSICESNRELLGDFVDEYGDGLDFSTKAKHVIRFHMFARELNKPFLSATRKDIKALEDFIDTRPAQRYNRKKRKWVSYRQCSPETKKENKDLLRLLYKWIEYSYKKCKNKDDRLKGAKLRHILRRKPAPELVEDVIDEEPTTRKYTADDMWTWEEVVRASQKMDCLRDKAAIQLIGEGALRIGEATAVKVEDIDFNHRQITVKHSEKNRTRKQRKVHFNSQFKARLMQYIKANKLGPEDTLGFPSKQYLNKVLKYYAAQAGIRELRDLKLHTCRKTHETYLTAMGINDMTITLHMGHTVDTALRYYIGGTLTQEDINKIRAILGDILNEKG